VACFVALLLLPIANGAFTAALRQASLRIRLRKLLDAGLSYSEDYGHSNYNAVDMRRGWRRCAALVLLQAPAIAAQAGFSPKEFPVQAAGAVNSYRRTRGFWRRQVWRLPDLPLCQET